MFAGPIDDTSLIDAVAGREKRFLDGAYLMNEDDPYLESEEFKRLAAVWTGMMLASIFVMFICSVFWFLTWWFVGRRRKQREERQRLAARTRRTTKTAKSRRSMQKKRTGSVRADKNVTRTRSKDVNPMKYSREPQTLPSTLKSTVPAQQDSGDYEVLNSMMKGVSSNTAKSTKSARGKNYTPLVNIDIPSKSDRPKANTAKHRTLTARHRTDWSGSGSGDSDGSSGSSTISGGSSSSGSGSGDE